LPRQFFSYPGKRHDTPGFNGLDHRQHFCGKLIRLGPLSRRDAPMRQIGVKRKAIEPINAAIRIGRSATDVLGGQALYDSTAGCLQHVTKRIRDIPTFLPWHEATDEHKSVAGYA
jgi:hypothetical protein